MTTLTRKQINDFLHTGHVIPVSKGLRQKWLNKNAPGWRDVDLMKALKRAKAIRRSKKHFSGYRACTDEVTLTRPGFEIAAVAKGHVKE